MRRLVFGLILASLAWLVGLAAFITTLPAPANGAGEIAARLVGGRSDAVVVYTGGGGKRITAGMALLADGVAERLLISGVHPDITRENVAEFWSGAPELFECCVDLGWEARSTIGNADETAQWVGDHGATRIVLVTSEYHMPRALAESRMTMPDIEITPHPVASGYLNENGKPASRKAWGQLAGEYNKFVLTKIKALFAFARN